MINHFDASDFRLRRNIIQNLNYFCLNSMNMISFEITGFDPYNTNQYKIKDNLTSSRISQLKYSLPAGVEPAISTVRGWRPRPLDHESMLKRS